MKTELRTLFYSPIAWLILIVFAFQVGMQYCNTFAGKLLGQELGYGVMGATSSLYSGYAGIMSNLLEYLYLYIPLLTMGLMSRELSSGSIKLLYSSPVTNFQIIVGKYLAALVFGLILCATFLLPMIHTAFFVVHPDFGLIFTALLGVFLTIAAYSAIGLFMSSMTKYQVVAVVGTLAILAILNFIGGVGQEYDFVRDITYWLSISGRSKTFIAGMISSHDLLYFILIITMFLALSIIKLQGERLKLSVGNRSGKYATVIVLALLVGYVSSRPKFMVYYDATTTKHNTLTGESQQILKKLKGGMTITTYSNVMARDSWRAAPRQRIDDLRKFAQYMRFKPEIRMKYVYYYARTDNEFIFDKYPEDTPIDTIYNRWCRDYRYNPAKKAVPLDSVLKVDDIRGENPELVRVISTESGKKATLRIYKDSNVDPFEPQISTALKTMIEPAVNVGFVTGHRERSASDFGEKGYASFASNVSFRYSLVNGGFDIFNVDLSSPVEDKINILLVADMREPLTPDEFTHFNEFIDRGGNLVILGEPKRQPFMNPLIERFGVRFEEGVVVTPTKTNLDDIVESYMLPDHSDKVSLTFGRLARRGYTVSTPSTCAIQVLDTTLGYTLTPILATPQKGSWVEKQTTDFLNEKSQLNPDRGETERSNITMAYLTRSVKDREQRIFILGDADCISTYELQNERVGFHSRNFSLITEMFRNLSYGKFPVLAERPPMPDNKYLGSNQIMIWSKVLIMGILPIAILLGAFFLLFTRKRK